MNVHKQIDPSTDKDAIFLVHGKPVEGYSSNEILEYTDSPIPLFLKCIYVLLPIWGIVSFLLFWNGSWGWWDRGFWSALQKAAHTTWESAPLPQNSQRMKTHY